MTDPSFKQKIVDECIHRLIERIDTLKVAMKNAQDAANNEEKSTAGDKYETARAMIQQEIDKYQLQLQDAAHQHSILSSIPLAEDSTIRNGSLAVTSQGTFFISVSIGELVVENKKYLAISSVSPIGNMLLGKAKGDTVQFRGKDYKIENVR